MPLDFEEASKVFPDYIDIPIEYYPPGVGPGGFSPSTMYASALAYQRGVVHELPIKSWVMLWLIDHIDWNEPVQYHASKKVVEQKVGEEIKEETGKSKRRFFITIENEQGKVEYGPFGWTVQEAAQEKGNLSQIFPTARIHIAERKTEND